MHGQDRLTEFNLNKYFPLPVRGLMHLFAVLSLPAFGAISTRDVNPVQSTTQPLPPGNRIFTCAHSFHHFVYPLLAEMAEVAGIKGHQSVGISMIGSSRVIQHWDLPPEKNEAIVALRAGKVDLLTLAPIWLPDEGIENFVRLGLEYNLAIRITVQEFWLPNDTYRPIYPLETHVKVDHNATKLADLRTQNTRYEHDIEVFVTDLNQRLGTSAVLVVPVGAATIDRREKIVAGEAPGLKSQEELFSDDWGHPRLPLRVLASYCHFAVIYRRSPVGLPMPVEMEKAKIPEYEKLNLLLQELAWNAVLRNPLTGLNSKIDGNLNLPDNARAR